MDIVIIAQYLCDFDEIEKSNGRFIYLSKLVGKSIENDVEIITSTFDHGKKKHFRNIPKKFKKCKITVIPEPGYRKNISLQRLYSHSVLANNIKKHLFNRKKPDVVYATVPSLSVAKQVVKYCEKMDVRIIIDIQDLWPEAFKMVFNIPLLSDLIFLPMKMQADYIYSSADMLLAVSNTYLERARRVNTKAKGSVVYLGTDKDEFDKYKCSRILNRKDVLKLVYVGTLGASYDLKVVFDALRMLDKELLAKIEFIILGDGPERKYFEQISKGLPVKFLGFLNYPEMVSCLCDCDIAVNPIKIGAAQSIINKHMDYAMAGLPVINTQECKEYRDLIDEYECGINCECGNAYSVKNALIKLINDRSLRFSMGRNSRKLAVERFDRSNTYLKIVNHIENTK